MKETEFLTEEIFTYVYNNYKKSIQGLQQEFMKEIEHNQQQFVDWVLYDYEAEKGKTYSQLYLQRVENKYTTSQLDYLEECNKAYFGIYEVIKLKDKEAELKDIFTGERVLLNSTAIEEDLQLYALILGRISREKKSIIGSDIILLPYHFKTLLSGQIVENYQMARNRDQYMSYEVYLKKNTPRILAIVERLLSYKNSEGDVTVYQSSYAIADEGALRLKLENCPEIVYDKAEALYHFMADNEILAELVIVNSMLEVECNSKEDRELVKGLLDEIIGAAIQHFKDENLTIDDII